MSDTIRVLLVDDDREVADLAATYLERADEAITVVVEPGADAGLARLAGDGTVDCVVSDYDMPDRNGLEFLEAVREAHPDLPFILFTGKGSEEIASDAISAGVTDYLQKETGTDQYRVLANRISNAVAQHRAEQAADDANRQLRRLFRRITDAFFALDENWRFTYINQRAADFTPYDPSEMVGMEIREVLPEDRAEEFYEAYRTAYEQQEVVTLETESAIEPGMWVEERVYPSEDGLSVYFRDITERKQVEQELQQTKGKIEDLHDIAAGVVACETPDEIYELTIEAAEEILDFDLCAVDILDGDELVTEATSSGVPDEGYYHGTPVDAEHNLAARTFRTGESYVVGDLAEADVEPAEHSYRSAISVPIGDIGVFQAVAERPGDYDEDDLELAELFIAHLAEALKRVRSERELRAERDRFAALFENVPNPVISAVFEDETPVVEDVNQAFERTFGWTADEVVGRSVDEFILPPGTESEARALNDAARRGDRIQGREVRRKTADGVRDFLFHTVPVQVGERTEGFSVYTDITEQKQRERELQRQNERLDEFASVVSHDLRNPINVAQGRLDLLARDCDSEHLEPIERAIDRMDALIEDVLALAKQGQVVDETEPVSLAGVARDGWATAVTESAELALDGDLGRVEADEGRLQELLENLFRNAIEHAGPDVTVRVGSLPGDGFFVADDGPGVPADEREAVFEHGYSTAEDGSGFGLAIVESIAEAHGWTVQVTAAETGGARFEIRE